jgi:hypothetical protein
VVGAAEETAGIAPMNAFVAASASSRGLTLRFFLGTVGLGFPTGAGLALLAASVAVAPFRCLAWVRFVILSSSICEFFAGGVGRGW